MAAQIDLNDAENQNKIDLDAVSNEQKFKVLKATNDFKYRMLLARVLAAIIIVSLAIVALSGPLDYFEFGWSEGVVSSAFDIVKMSLTGLLGFLLGRREMTEDE